MAQDTLLGFPAHTFPYHRGEFTKFIDSLNSFYTSRFFLAFRSKDGP